MTNNKKDQIKKIKDFSFAVRKNILEMAFAAGASSSHFGGALSIADIVSVLFSYQMKINSKDPKWKDRDRFILSKGHACLAYYAALCEVGYISKDELSTFEKDETNLLGHPVINRDLGIDFLSFLVSSFSFFFFCFSSSLYFFFTSAFREAYFFLTARSSSFIALSRVLISSSIFMFN